MANHPNRGPDREFQPWPRSKSAALRKAAVDLGRVLKRDFIPVAAAVAANHQGVALSSEIYDSPSVYDARQWGVCVWRTQCNRVLVVSYDNYGLDSAVLNSFDLPDTSFNRKSELYAIVSAAGVAAM